MPTGAVSPSKSNVGAGVDSQAVVLVLYYGSRDVYPGRRANVESIRVVSALGVAERVVHVDIVQAKIGHRVDAESLNRRVQDIKRFDIGVFEVMSTKKLRFCLSAV